MNLKSELNKHKENITTGFTSFCALLLAFAVVSSFYSSPSHAADIHARAAVVINGDDDALLYGKNPDLKLPPASTTKLITAMVALDTLGPDEEITISKKAALTSSVRPHLSTGEKISVRDLLSLALIRSINGAAVALAEASAGTEKAFVHMMNEKAQAISALDTRFINASGLPGKGQYTTARDLAKIMKKALTYPLIADIIRTPTAELDVKGRTVVINNTNNLLWTDDGHLGGKTGYTRAARHCFVGASDKEDGTLIIALLGDASRTRLWTDAEKLLSREFQEGTVIIDARENNKAQKRQKAVHRKKTKRSRTKSL
ncbi:MAG: D-alanyl-D-alanine carboxypeptidase [Nitrospiraceae bacterium]|nr:MAG: D-alanyl-D-alanine carboxypeptidase [Nitrospiraceae bacterium]